MMRVLIVLYLSFAFIAPAFATDQANDSITIGGKTYGIFQLPMNGLWRYEDEEPDGRIRFPSFDMQHSANHRGYVADFSIEQGKLYLDSIKGKIDGRDLVDSEIIDKQFPVHANWYSGSIFISIGGHDKATKQFRYVIEFSISRGKVIATRYTDSVRIPTAWNGLDKSQANDTSTKP